MKTVIKVLFILLIALKLIDLFICGLCKILIPLFIFVGAREEYGEDQKAGGSAGGEGELYTDSYSRRVRKKPGDRNYG